MKRILLFALAGVLALGGVASCKKEGGTTYTVTFNSRGGSAVASQTVTEGSKISKPANPTRSNYDFIDWTKGATGGGAWSFSTDVVNSDITLYAQWESVALENLETAILVGNALDPSDYTADSWATFTAALEAAEAVDADPGATETQIEKALNDLQDAFDHLVVAGGSNARALLEGAITVAGALNSGNYTPDSWANLTTTLVAAKTADENSAATDADLTDAYNNLENAIKGLVFDPNVGGNNSGTGSSGGSGNTTPTTVSKDALKAAIANANTKVEANYTPASWASMQTALTNATNVDANTNASQTQVNVATTNLNQAVAALVSNSSTDPGAGGAVNKSDLGSSIADAQKLNSADYTTDSWATLQGDLSTAQGVYNDPNATQQDVNTAYTTLQTGINQLQPSAANDGLVSSLLNQLISLVNSLPSKAAIQNNPLLVATTIPVATLADTVRDQLTAILGTNNPQLNGLSSTLNGVLGVVGLDNLI